MKCKNCKNLNKQMNWLEGYQYPWCYEINDSPDIEVERECSKYYGKTNGDRIRNMSNEELAEHIFKIDQSEHIKFCQNKPKCCECDEEITTDMCKQCVLEWLQKEVE